MGKGVLNEVYKAVAIPQMSAQEAVEASRAKRAVSGPKDHLVCFYSSYYGGIVKDPSVMSMPLDDHMVGRGHGMFDTGGFKDGRFYRLQVRDDTFHSAAARLVVSSADHDGGGGVTALR